MRGCGGILRRQSGSEKASLEHLGMGIPPEITHRQSIDSNAPDAIDSHLLHLLVLLLHYYSCVGATGAIVHIIFSKYASS